MKIVGVGCGPEMLSEEAVSAIAGADLIYGSKRAIELASGHIREECEARVITDYKGLKFLPENAVVLSTGDPMLAGLGYLNGEIIPGISSYQYACARLKVQMTKTAIVNAHAKDHEKAAEDILFEISRGKIAFVIADPDFDIGALAEKIPADLSGCRIAVCEQLGYKDERISIGDINNLPEAVSGLFVLFVGIF